MNLPVPVALNRFAAALRVLSFGIDKAELVYKNTSLSSLKPTQIIKFCWKENFVVIKSYLQFPKRLFAFSLFPGKTVSQLIRFGL